MSGISAAIDSVTKELEKGASQVNVPLLGGKQLRIGWSAEFLLILVGAAAMALGIWLIPNRVSAKQVLFTAFMVLGWTICLLIHEQGHAIFAEYAGEPRAEGYTDMNYRKYKNPIHSIIIPLATMLIFGIGVTGGVDYLSPETLQQADRFKRFLIALGGVFWSLIFCELLSLPLWFFWYPANYDDYVLIGLGTLNYLQLYSVIVNLVPLPPTDMFTAIYPQLPESIRDRVAQFVNHQYYSIACFACVIVFAFLFHFLIDFLIMIVSTLLLINIGGAYQGLCMLYSLEGCLVI